MSKYGPRDKFFDIAKQMTVPSTNVTMSSIQTVLGGTRPLSMGAYYSDIAGGPGYNVTGLPKKGSSIAMGHFRGAKKPITALLYPPPWAEINSDNFYFPGDNDYAAGQYTFKTSGPGFEIFRQFAGNDGMNSDWPWEAWQYYNSDGLANGSYGASWTSTNYYAGEWMEVTLPYAIIPTRWRVSSRSTEPYFPCSWLIIGYLNSSDRNGDLLGSSAGTESVDMTISATTPYIRFRIVLTRIPPFTYDNAPHCNHGTGGCIYGTKP
jgi:hypothetical protein